MRFEIQVGKLRFPAKQLRKGKLVGQIIVRIKGGKKRENESRIDGSAKKRKNSGEDGKISPSLIRPGAKKDKSEIIALLKQAITENPRSLTASKVQDVSGVTVVEINTDINISR